MSIRRRHFLQQFFATVMLAIFSLAITPWSALHNHEEHAPIYEKNCTHTVHVKASADNCLLCKAHFEKNYTANFNSYAVLLKSGTVESTFLPISGSFREIIASCLRGPPSFS